MSEKWGKDNPPMPPRLRDFNVVELPKKTSALSVWQKVKKYMNYYHNEKVFGKKVQVKTVEGEPISIVEDALKGVEILKGLCVFHFYETYEGKCYVLIDGNEYEICKKDYEVLREVFE